MLLERRNQTTMAFATPPEVAAWQHRDARDGFEVVFLHAGDDGYRLEGHTAAVEDGQAWAVRYLITLDAGWHTRSARVSGRSETGLHELTLEADGTGSWRINGAKAPHLDGCLDVDLESSSCTNAFPVHRLGLEVGQDADAPAAYVRALDLSVQRLEQRYVRMENRGEHERYDYTSPAFGFESQLVYDEFGLVLEYPGIAVRAA
jgi:uncharacterized protein